MADKTLEERRVEGTDALRVAQDYIAYAFHRDDREKPRHSIPAQDDDHDLVLTRYIKQSTAEHAALVELLREARKVLRQLVTCQDDDEDWSRALAILARIDKSGVV